MEIAALAYYELYIEKEVQQQKLRSRGNKTFHLSEIYEKKQKVLSVAVQFYRDLSKKKKRKERMY